MKKELLKDYAKFLREIHDTLAEQGLLDFANERLSFYEYDIVDEYLEGYSVSTIVSAIKQNLL